MCVCVCTTIEAQKKFFHFARNAQKLITDYSENHRKNHNYTFGTSAILHCKTTLYSEGVIQLPQRCSFQIKQPYRKVTKNVTSKCEKARG